MHSHAPIVLTVALALAGCGGGGGGGPVGTGAEPVPAVTAEPAPADPGEAEETAVPDPVTIEGEQATVIIEPFDDASSFLTLLLQRSGGLAAIRTGTCAQPGPVVEELGQAVAGETGFPLGMSLEAATESPHVLTVGDAVCVALQR